MKIKKRKDPKERTKVVIRNLPPSLSESLLFSLFSHRFNWSSFRPGKEKTGRCSRAYIDFKSANDVLEFYEFFNGHLFVTDTGAQFKAIVEYAPSQCIPKPSTFKDTREGTIYQDPEYLEFLKVIVKPVEKLPNVDIQLEVEESEPPGPIVTPLMEFVRQRRVAGGATKVKKLTGRSLGSASSRSTKRATDRKKHIKKGSAKNVSWSGKATILCRKEMSEMRSVSGAEGSACQFSLTGDSVKKTNVLQKVKQHASSPDAICCKVSDDMNQQLHLPSVPISSSVSAASKKNSMHKVSETLIRGIIAKNEAHQNLSVGVVHSKKDSRYVNLENSRQPHRSKYAKVNLHTYAPEMECRLLIPDLDAKRKPESGINKRNSHRLGKNCRDDQTGDNNMLDSCVLTNLRHLDITNEGKLSPTVLESRSPHFDNVKNSIGEKKIHMDQRAHAGRSVGNSSGSINSVVKGGRRHVADRDGGSFNAAERKPFQKQVWVLKTTSDS